MKEVTMTADEALKNTDASLAQLLATRIAIENLTRPVGKRFQDEFEKCLTETQKTLQYDLAGLSFLYERPARDGQADMQVEVSNERDMIAVTFYARRPMIVTEHSSKTGTLTESPVKAKREES